MKDKSTSLTRFWMPGVLLMGSMVMAGCAGNSVKPASTSMAPIASNAHSSETQANTNNTEAVVTNKELSMPETTDSAEKYPQIDISENTQPDKKRFFFAFDKTQLGDTDIEIIRQHARFMIDNPGLLMKISGHTDKSGPREYNEYLSKQRASEVAKILISEGVPESQLVIKARADEEPLQNVAEAHKNRRVELEYQELNLVSTQ
jgi:peptidoglycan-associated lipoprotein